MPINVNQGYSQFFVGTEQLKSYGSNSAAKKDTVYLRIPKVITLASEDALVSGG